MSSNEPYLITGAGTDVQPRLEIRDLIEKQPKQFTLFVLAWNEIRDPKYDPPAARYFDQASIHGRPYERWRGDPKANPKGGLKGKSCAIATINVSIYGMSPAGSRSVTFLVAILFPTWHRPSLMLLEQSIWEAAKKHAEKFAQDDPDQASAWREAANKLRFPYWDWTNPEKHDFKFPEVLRQPKVEVETPKGLEKHENPLYSYDFGEELPSGDAGFRDVSNREFLPKAPGDKQRKGPVLKALFGQWKRTYRWPTHNHQEGDENPTEQFDKLDSYLNQKPAPNNPYPDGSWKDLKRQVGLLFQYPEDLDESDGVYAWDAFSNTGAESQPKENDWKNAGDNHYWKIAKKLKGKASLEQPHNLVHLLVGGLGHMMNNDYASFDPVFFLHHCNVDRILAFWEYAYPKYFMGHDGYKDKNDVHRQFEQPRGKFGWGDGPLYLKGDTPLTPFRKADGSYWTSDDARWGSKVPKNYTYEDIELGKKILDPLGPEDVSARLSLSLSHETPSDAIADSTQQRFELQCPQAQNLQVESARGCLQKLFGFNPVVARQNGIKKLGGPKLVYPENEKEPYTSGGRDPIVDFRCFVVRIRVDPYAFGTSYVVKLGFNVVDPTGQTTLSGHIGSAAILGRSEDTECDACQGRREAGAKSVYNIMIPHGVITNLALHSGEMQVVPLLLKALSGQIELPGGHPVANTPITLPADATPIPKELLPEITLHSSAIQALDDGTGYAKDQAQDHAPLTPYEPYDWQYHADLFPNWALV
ncbi:unnamed protein product [Rhizoctonia solani]|uniref:tyrosinase n=1 Tax=Rhizoctonia solani TaxID=456999 RepID=A0A8H3DKS2_9AGAM|nr:unnamed protein product [Rhizoctonia solani]